MALRPATDEEFAETGLALAVEHPKTNPRAAEKKARTVDEQKKIDAIRRDEASTIAADMEMGYYLAKDGTQWEAKPFVLWEVFRRMGYSESIVRKASRLRWWPGTDAFRRHVSWKIAVRKMQQHLDLTRQNAWAGPLIGLAVEEMGWRLAHVPEEVSNRDLAELVTKLTKIFADGAPSSGGTAPRGGENQAPGTLRYSRITEAIELIPEGPAREKALRDYQTSVDAARAALPAPQS